MRVKKVTIWLMLLIVLLGLIAYQIKGPVFIYPWEKSWYEKKALSGDVTALRRLYGHYDGLPGGRGDTIVWLRVGASKNITEFQYLLGVVLESDGMSVESDCWFGRAGLSGHSGSALRTAKYYKNLGNEALSFEWLRWASVLDHNGAKLDLADMLMADTTISDDQLFEAHILYIDVMNSTKDGSIFNKLAKKGVERLSKYGFDKAQNPVFKEESFKPNENMKLSVIEMCELF